MEGKKRWVNSEARRWVNGGKEEMDKKQIKKKKIHVG